MRSRLEEIQRAFEEMGLGRPEDRERFLTLGKNFLYLEACPPEDEMEIVYVDLGINTRDDAERTEKINGQLA